MFICTIEVRDISDNKQSDNYLTACTYRFDPELNKDETITLYWQEVEKGYAKDSYIPLECLVTGKKKELFPQGQNRILQRAKKNLKLSDNEYTLSMDNGLFWKRIFVEVTDTIYQK